VDLRSLVRRPGRGGMDRGWLRGARLV